MTRVSKFLLRLWNAAFIKPGKISVREKGRLDFEAMPVDQREVHIVFKKEPKK